MTPGTTISNVTDEPHRNAEPFGQKSSRAKGFGSEEDFADLVFSEFCGPHSFASRPHSSLTRSPMISAPWNLFRVLSGIVVFARNLFQRLWGMSASPCSTVPFSISAVLFRCGPIEIARSVVRWISIAVRAVFFVGRTRAIESFAHKSVDRPMQGSAIHSHRRSGIAPNVSQTENSPRILALPIRHSAPNPASIRDFVIGRFSDRFPFFCHANISSLRGIQCKALD